MLDKGNMPIKGFTDEDCDLIRGNHVHYIVTWHGKNDVSRFAGKIVRLRFEMRNAKLYAFQFVE